MAGKAARRIIRIITDTAGILALMILLAGAGLMLADIRPAIVVSGSMEPVIHTGSMVFVDTNERDIVEKDIIAFDAGGTTVTHRVVGIREDGFVTKGDANESNDPGIVGQSDVGGKVVMWIPKIGYAAAALRSPAGIMLLISSGIALLLMNYALGKEAGTDGKNKNTAGSDGAAA
ncbi:MAG: signal peptidase I [Lentihominibacter sp.]|nr:signal peptidase I [Lentihominibacter sp.]